MPQLDRGGHKLLGTVNGKTHATQSDHYDVLPTPPRSASTTSSFVSSKTPQETDEGDVNRDPESSDEEQAAFQLPKHQIDGAEDEQSTTATFKQPAKFSPASTGSKRSHDPDQLSSEGDGKIFSPERKKQKTSVSSNIHAKKDKKGYGAFQRRKSGQKRDNQKAKSYGKKTETVALAPQFKKPTWYPKTDAENATTTPVFRDVRNRDDHTRDPDIRQSLSPSLSSLSDPPSSPEVEEIHHLDLPAPQTYIAQTECAFCSRAVDKFLKERFEDEHLNGKDMTYKWQERFCLFHKRHDARDVYEDRGYPKIDWDVLESRMERHRDYLRNIIRGLIPSYHRDRLSEKLRGRPRSAMQALDSDESKKGASVGYYGPRGEKLMTDHIVNHLSEELREQSVKDRLVAASGVSGGVSGFVHGVLVPELAERLVKEDMEVSEDKARTIIAENVELGELLHPDVDDAMIVDVAER